MQRSKAPLNIKRVVIPESASSKALATLKPEVLKDKIFSFLNIPEQRTMTSVNKGFFHTANKDVVIKNTFLNNFGYLPPFNDDLENQLKAAVIFRKMHKEKDRNKKKKLSLEFYHTFLKHHRNKPWAQAYLGFHFFNFQDSIPHGYQIGMHHLKKSVMANDFFAASYLIKYIHGCNRIDLKKCVDALTPAYVKKIRECLENSLSSGKFKNALLYLGIIHLCGYCGPIDKINAEKYLLRAINEFHQRNQNLTYIAIDAMFALTYGIYLATKPDEKPSAEMIRKTIQFLKNTYERMPCSEVANQLAFVYLDHLGNAKKAIRWFSQGSFHDDNFSAHKLAKLFYDGEHVERNLQKSKRWYQRAFELGDALSAIRIATSIDEGVFAGNAIEKAEWCKKAFFSGDEDTALSVIFWMYIATDNWHEHIDMTWWLMRAAIYFRGHELSILKNIIENENIEITDYDRLAYQMLPEAKVDKRVSEVKLASIEKFKEVGEQEGLMTDRIRLRLTLMGDRARKAEEKSSCTPSTTLSGGLRA